MIKLSNKKGDKILSVYWFAILVIVAVGVILMVNIFYGESYDVRKIEARVLAEKVADCIYFGGKPNNLLFSQNVFREDFRDNFMDFCDIDFTPLAGGPATRPEYYFEVNFSEDTNLKTNVFEISGGNSNWKTDCSESIVGSRKLAVCVSKEFL